uniref:Putative kazal type serine protease inhibitor n=1 Tax=Panstrongylus lignarius TaxID=156445 RepID=A0A224Y3Q8_9HEMI
MNKFLGERITSFLFMSLMDEFSVLALSIELTGGQQQCNIACTGEYNPVCGEQNQFLRVFTNRCRLDRENSCGANPPWTFVRTGQCPF